MTKFNGGARMRKTALTNRRKVALENLKQQLKIGTKPGVIISSNISDPKMDPLTDSDKERIMKEIQVLETRIKSI